MGLKKLFHKEEHDKKKLYDQKRNSSKSSSLSISNWTHKDKKRHSSVIPTPTLSASSFVTAPINNNTRENKVTQRHSMYSPSTFTKTPLTPSESLGDVNDVVNVLRNSSSSEFSSSFTTASNEDLNLSPEQMNNPFLAGYSNDSNKYEILEEDTQEDENAFHSLLYQNGRVTPDSATTNTKKETEDSLYSELLHVQQQLNAANPNNAVQIKKQLEHANKLLTKALDSSMSLETKVKSIVQSSKETIMTIGDENKALKQEQETSKSEIEHQASLLTQLGQKYDSLHADHAKLAQENQELIKKDAQLKEVSLLLGSTTTNDDNNSDLHNKLKYVLDLSQRASQLEEEQRTMSEKIQALEIEHANQIKEKEQHIARIEQEHTETKLKLESCTTQIREFVEEKNRLLAQIEINNNVRKDADKQDTDLIKELQDKIKTVEEENKQLKDDLVTLETVSREAARSVMDENERLEHQIQQLELLHSGNDEEVEHLCDNTSKRVLVADNRQLKSKLKIMEQVQAENASLTELVGCLQVRIKELYQPMRSNSGSNILKNKLDPDQQEELMRMHTRSQLGLIEYLEGEDDIMLTMSKFKKQLEADMREFDSTDKLSSISLIRSVSASQSMR
ncbi:uncharacterized protein B0P05DRAFT_542568 [Gilbertella persicaria]|uniref:uncharacterized protein n=1 Tax=Gilbertella persicaria TaxID=101096 RepID=UPI00222024EE|nr:uncharacterized protein B0P05DRAFT_542568 [Gilbertella persicaria]KAI8078117.1 hypothetical protein B0P05DRAFT_542568 [Gilbertella persicaria]